MVKLSQLKWYQPVKIWENLAMICTELESTNWITFFYLVTDQSVILGCGPYFLQFCEITPHKLFPHAWWTKQASKWLLHSFRKQFSNDSFSTSICCFNCVIYIYIYSDCRLENNSRQMCIYCYDCRHEQFFTNMK